MNAINNLVNKVGNGFCYGLDIAAFTVTHNEPLEKVAKISDRMIRISEIVFNGLSEAFSNLSTQLRDTIIVFETLRFIGIVNLLICPRNGKYYLTDPNNSWQKRLDRVNLAFHCSFKSFKGLSKFGFVSMGVMAKEVIGKLPIFTLTMDSFMLASSFFSAWDSLGVNMPKVRAEMAKADMKIDKWENLPTDIAYLKANMETESAHFETKYNIKAIKLSSILEDLEKDARLNEDILLKANQETQLPKATQEKIISECTAKAGALSLKIDKVQAKQQKNEDRIVKVAAKNFKGLAEDLEQKDVNLKLRKWEVLRANAKQELTKTWLRVANSVVKFAAIILALTLTTIGLWTAPATLSLLVMGVFADSVGLTKLLVEAFWKEKPIPVNFTVSAPVA